MYSARTKMHPLSCEKLSIGSVLGFLWWNSKPYPRDVFLKIRLIWVLFYIWEVCCVWRILAYYMYLKDLKFLSPLSIMTNCIELRCVLYWSSVTWVSVKYLQSCQLSIASLFTLCYRLKPVFIVYVWCHAELLSWFLGNWILNSDSACGSVWVRNLAYDIKGVI
jgi:hypothetical protein